jgi:hypothetical protein
MPDESETNVYWRGWREATEACAKLADDYATKLMQWTIEAERKGKNEEANAFRAQRVAAANLAGQIRARINS